MIRILFFCGLFVAAVTGASADRYALVLSGSGGTDEYTERFTNWTDRLYDSLTGTLQFDPSHVHVLADGIPSASYPVEAITQDTLEERFAALRHSLSDHDTLFVFMIGHGSWIRKESRFHIPGRDVTAQEISDWLDPLELESLVLINTTSSSAGFINKLSRPGIVVCSATRDPGQTNATEFMELFLRGIEDSSADINRDEQISVLEACERAAELTQRWYEDEEFIASESSLLDDNGDSLGTRLPIAPVVDGEDPAGLDGALAANVWLKPFPLPEGISPVTRERYFAALNEIEELKKRKDTLDEEAYYAALEDLLIEAATLNREMKTSASILNATQEDTSERNNN